MFFVEEENVKEGYQQMHAVHAFIT